jgi:hypothetical protein
MLPRVPVAGLDIVTRLGLALRTKSLNDELRLADVSLRSAVLTDSLTGLANRRAAEERLRSLTAWRHRGPPRGRGLPAAPPRHQARRRLVRGRAGPPSHHRQS